MTRQKEQKKEKRRRAAAKRREERDRRAADRARLDVTVEIQRAAALSSDGIAVIKGLSMESDGTVIHGVNVYSNPSGVTVQSFVLRSMPDDICLRLAKWHTGRWWPNKPIKHPLEHLANAANWEPA